MDLPKDPFQALCRLPQPILDWHEADIYREQMRMGLAPCYKFFWDSLNDPQRWRLVALLTDSFLPKDMPCPKVTLTKRAAPLKTTALRSQNDGLKSADLDYIPSQAPSDEETEKVKQIMLTWQNVRLIGMKGSGKTSKARWICQNRLSQGHKIHWINPHLSAHDSQLLKALGVNIVGGGRDYDAIADFCKQWVMGENSKLTESYDRYASEIGAKFQPITFVVDELTNYKELVGEPIEVFIKASIQEFSKINWSTVYVTHNDTLACMACPSGFSDAIRDNLFDLRTEADPLQGNRIPKAIGKYRMPSEHRWTDVKIPVEWQ
jgi:hypothetical protein